jgi:type I restriction enzyme S subunit
MNKYQSYKPSGVEWVGEIPEKWRISKFKYVSKLYTGNSLNDEQKVLYESDDEYHIPYVSSKDIDLNTRSVNYNNGLRIPKENNPLKVSPKDSFLLCVEGGSSGRKMVYLDREVCFVNKLCSFKSVENTRFQYYFIQSSNFQDKFRLSLSGLIGGVSISTLRDFELVLPSIQEQYQIVQFLDEKTELIDKLISTKERKITLLKEQRTSLINQVVTKGLNPNVKIKDSGIEWIGEIPEHWELKPLKYLIKNLNSGVSVNSENVPVEDEIELGVLKTSCVYGDLFRPEENKKVVIEEIGRVNCPVLKDSIIISRMNTPELVGSSGYVHQNYSNLFLPDRLWITEFKEEVDVSVQFYSYILKSDRYKKTLSSKSTGTSSSMKNISKNDLLSLPVPYFDLKEQHEITTNLNEFSKKCDDLIQLEQKKIDLLKEYRQSLISEVVTGKIKVTQ